MSLLLVLERRHPEKWKEILLKEDADLDIEIWPEVKEPEKVQFAVVWRHPQHSLNQFPNLKAVSSLGAGVDHILRDETLPEGVKICRVVDDNLVEQMKDYLTAAVLDYYLNTYTYYQQKQEGTWKPLPKKKMDSLKIGVMGLGQIGRPVAKRFVDLGFEVTGWSNSPKDIDGVQTFAGKAELTNFLKETNVLICLLPLTPQTKGILNLDLFKKLKQPGYLINAGRGGQLVDEDLIYAFDKGLLEGAQLDVFNEEPLPEKHPFWNRQKIIITPHVSAETDASEVAPQIIENYKRLLSGMPLKNSVKRQRGY